MPTYVPRFYWWRQIFLHPNFDCNYKDRYDCGIDSVCVDIRSYCAIDQSRARASVVCVSLSGDAWTVIGRASTDLKNSRYLRVLL